MAAVMIYITTGSHEEAVNIARQLVSERLAACANILPGIRSIYRWEGDIHDDPEVTVVLKSTEARVADLTARVQALHSYESPCVVAVPISGGNPDFLNWVVTETAMTEATS